jgi:hypothetical protein
LPGLPVQNSERARIALQSLSKVLQRIDDADDPIRLLQNASKNAGKT